ncbi:MAG: hypothetical protein R3F05_17110 [Planctomycetota bacterium]
MRPLVLLPVLVVLLVAPAGCGGCIGSDNGILRVENPADTAEGQAIVGTSVARPGGSVVAASSELILPGEIADIVIAGGTYEVTVTWSGGGTTTRTVKVDDTPGETGTEEDAEPCDLERTRVQFAPPP